MSKNRLLLVCILVFALGFVCGAFVLGSAVAAAYMSPDNTAAPIVTTFCDNGEASVKFEVTSESSHNWYSFNKLFSSDGTAHSQSPYSVSSITLRPVEPGIHTMTVRQTLDFEADSFPDDGRLMAFQVIFVPYCGD